MPDVIGSPGVMPDLNWGGGIGVAIGAASAQSAAINARAVLVSADQNCWIKLGANPTATVGAGSLFLSTNGDPLLLSMQPNWKIAVIQATAAGNLSIIPCIYLP